MLLYAITLFSAAQLKCFVSAGLVGKAEYTQTLLNKLSLFCKPTNRIE